MLSAIRIVGFSALKLDRHSLIFTVRIRFSTCEEDEKVLLAGWWEYVGLANQTHATVQIRGCHPLLCSPSSRLPFTRSIIPLGPGKEAWRELSLSAVIFFMTGHVAV